MGDFELLAQLITSKVRSRPVLDAIYSQLMLLPGLRQYIFDLPESARLGVLRAVELQLLQANEVLFLKGDKSDRLYIVLRGSLGAYDGHSGPADSQLTEGKVFGDRGLVRKLPRLYTCRANSPCALLTISAVDFKAFLEPAFHNRYEEKLMHIDSYLPGAKNLPLHAKDKLAAVLVLQDFPKGRRLATPGRLIPNLYLLRTGECTLRAGSMKLVRLGPGSWLGEEALFGHPSAYWAEVTAENTSVFTVTPEDLTRSLPEPVIENMRRQFKLKQQSRTHLAEKLHNTSMSDLSAVNLDGAFRLAHPGAKRRLVIAQRRSPSSTHIQEWSKLRQELHHYTPCWPDGFLSARP